MNGPAEVVCPVDGCNRPRHRDHGVCRHHGWQLERALAETPALVTELDLTITRQTASGARVGSRATDHPLPVDLAASEALVVLRSTLEAWVAELRQMHPATPAPRRRWPGDVGLLAVWLAGRHTDLLAHPAADEAVGEVLAATEQGWRAVDRHTAHRVDLPDPCPECGAPLRAVLHEVGDPRPNRVWCLGADPHEWRPEQWLRLGHRLGYGRDTA